MSFNGHSGPPDVLPFGYGAHTGGQYGRLAIQDAPDYLTNRPPFRGPGGTTPLNRGGPNLPSHAPPIQESAGGVMPATTAWPGVSNGAPQTPGTPYAQQYQWAGFGYNDARGLGSHPTYSGFFDRFKVDPAKQAVRQAARSGRQDARAAAAAQAATHRDVGPPITTGGYYYRQYANGEVDILPGSPTGVGLRLTPTGKNATNWSHVTNEIGPFQAATGAGFDLNSALTALTQITSNVAPLIGGGGAQAPAYDPSMDMAPTAPAPSSGIPMVAWVVGGVALLGGVVYFATKRRS